MNACNRMVFCLAKLSVFLEIYIILYDIPLKGQSLKYHTNYIFTGPCLSAGDQTCC